MTLSNFQGHLPIASLFKRGFAAVYATLDKLSTNVVPLVHRTTVPHSGCQQIAVPNAIEILPKIWTAWVGCTSVTDRQTDRQTNRQTDDRQQTTDRQTDGRQQIANVNVA